MRRGFLLLLLSCSLAFGAKSTKVMICEHIAARVISSPTSKSKRIFWDNRDPDGGVHRENPKTDIYTWKDRGSKPELQAVYSNDKISWKDRDSEAFFIADLDSNGTFSFGVHSRKKNGELANPDFRAAEALKNSLTFFGEQVTAVEGTWLGSWQGREYVEHKSTNYFQFARAIENGKSPKDAAFSTWTGQQAKKNGFSEIAHIKYIRNSYEGYGDEVVDRIEDATAVIVTFVRSKN